MERKIESGEGETEAERERKREMAGLAELSTTAAFYMWGTSPKDQVVLWKRELLSINPSNIPGDTHQITTSRLCFSPCTHTHSSQLTHILLLFLSPLRLPSFREAEQTIVVQKHVGDTTHNILSSIVFQ